MAMLEGKVAVITGAGSGMAKAATKLFVEEGAKVVAADISGAEKETANEVGEGVLPVHCDVSKEEDVAAAFDAAMKTFGRVDSVLNAAGIPGTSGPLEEVRMEDYDECLNIDLRGVLLCMKYGVRAILAGGQGGSIVNWSSIAGNTPFPTATFYNIAKSGVIGLTKSAALDYGAMNIRVNAVCPGIIRTKMGQDALDTMPVLGERPPLGRVGEAVEVAYLAAFLCSDRGAYISGAIIPVDGGWSVKIALL